MRPSKLRLWYRYLRRRSRSFRRMCVSFLTIAMVLSRTIEQAVKFYTDWLA